MKMPGNLLQAGRRSAVAIAAAAIVLGGAGAAQAGDSLADIDVAISGAPATLNLNDNTLVTYVVTVRNLDPVGGDAATGTKLSFLVADKPYQSAPLTLGGQPMPALNYTPSQGASIRTATPSDGASTCTIKLVTTPADPSPPLSSRSYGEVVQCALSNIAAADQITVTIEVEANLNTFVVLQPLGTMVAVAAVTSGNEPSLLNSLNNVAYAQTDMTR